MTQTDEFQRDLVTDAEADDVQGFNPAVIPAGVAIAVGVTGVTLGATAMAAGIGIGYYLGSSSTSTTSENNNCPPKGR